MKLLEPSKQTISEAKIKEIPVPDNTEEFTAPTGYRFMDMSILDHGLLIYMDTGQNFQVYQRRAM